ncbi:virB8 family protein [Robbsia andropogonis]|uniref:virB8 family protein n=1 Tax=Robbsia andropogonis TaxID=28092 RepID=UPI002A6B4756|nr:type IV secretion system protein [Robbsia andropogonis]
MKWVPRKLAATTSAPGTLAANAYATALRDASAALADADPRDMARMYFKQALVFEQSRQQLQENARKIAWRVAGGALFIALASIIGSAVLVQLKRPSPPVIIRDNTATGNVEVIDVARSGSVSFGELEVRAALRQYVELRESYDWYTIQDAYDTVSLMNSEREQGQYASLYDHKNSPQNILTDKYRVIAHIGAITFIGSTAQVFFSKTMVPLSSQGSGAVVVPKTEYWVATITYEIGELPTRSNDQTRNPTGFRVTSYSVDRDWTRSTTDSVVPMPSAATAAQSAPSGGGARP